MTESNQKNQDKQDSQAKDEKDKPVVPPVPPTSVPVEPAQPEDDVSVQVAADEPEDKGTLIGGKYYDVTPEGGHRLRQS